MSRNDWEAGSIVLPAAAVAPLKAALRDAANKLHADVLAEAKRIHTEVAKGTASIKLHDERVRAFSSAFWASRGNGMQYRFAAPARSAYAENVHSLAIRLIDGIAASAARAGKGMRAPQLGDVEHLARRYTNKDTTFALPWGEGCISFTGRTVTYSSGENNRAAEAGRESLLGTVFFDALSKIAWTRGTGGELVGNDEYNQDSRESGGGANYSTGAWGPIGDAAKVERYVRNGFNRKEAAKMVADSKRPIRSAYWR